MIDAERQEKCSHAGETVSQLIVKNNFTVSMTTYISIK